MENGLFEIAARVDAKWVKKWKKKSLKAREKEAGVIAERDGKSVRRMVTEEKRWTVEESKERVNLYFEGDRKGISIWGVEVVEYMKIGGLEVIAGSRVMKVGIVRWKG